MKVTINYTIKNIFLYLMKINKKKDKNKNFLTKNVVLKHCRYQMLKIQGKNAIYYKVI